MGVRNLERKTSRKVLLQDLRILQGRNQTGAIDDVSSWWRFQTRDIDLSSFKRILKWSSSKELFDSKLIRHRTAYVRINMLQIMECYLYILAPLDFEKRRFYTNRDIVTLIKTGNQFVFGFHSQKEH